MNVVRTALAAALFLSSALFVGAIAGADDWGQALQWVDKYPSDKLGTNGTGLLDQPLFKRVLHRVLPKAEAATLTKLTVESVVQQMGDYMVVHKCLAHNCPSEMAVVIVDVKKQQLWVGLFSREAQRTSTRWYGTAGDYFALPEEIKKDFLQRQQTGNPQ